MIHPLAGVLSAYGMGLADLVELRQRSLGGRDAGRGAGRAARPRRSRRWRGRASRRPTCCGGRRCATRAAIRRWRCRCPADMRAAFEAAHLQRFGFVAPETAVVVETAIVEARSAPPRAAGEGDPGEARWRGNRRDRPPLPLHRQIGGPPPHRHDGEDSDRPRSRSPPATSITGPALDHRPLRDHRGRARLARRGRRARQSHPHPRDAPRRRAPPSDRGRSGHARGHRQSLHGDRRGDGGGAAEHGVVGQHQGAARFLLRAVRRRGRPDRQCAAHPGPSRLDGRIRSERSSPRGARRATAAA